MVKKYSYVCRFVLFTYIGKKVTLITFTIHLKQTTNYLYSL